MTSERERSSGVKEMEEGPEGGEEPDQNQVITVVPGELIYLASGSHASAKVKGHKKRYIPI